MAMPYTALGFVYAGKKLKDWMPRLPDATLLARALLVVACLLAVPRTLRSLNHEYRPVLRAIAWVQARVLPGQGVLCNSRYVRFYSRLPVAFLREHIPDSGVAWADAPRDTNYKYAILNVNAYGYRPEWLEQIQAKYRPVVEFDDPHPTTRLPIKAIVFVAKDAADQVSDRPQEPANRSR
jgi:hypothetical protein